MKEEVRKQLIIASGGVHTGMEGAKAMPDMVGLARLTLKAATRSREGVSEVMKTEELELQMTMFAIGAASLKRKRRIG